MNNNNFDHLLVRMTNDVTKFFVNNLQKYPDLHGDIDTSPLLNLTIGVLLGTLINLLDEIKLNTEGEDILFDNIALTKHSIIQAIENLPFITSIDWIYGMSKE